MDVSAAIIFHGEQALAPVALRSFLSCCTYARKSGVAVEAIAIMDRADRMTADIVRSFAPELQMIEAVDFGDLGGSRNRARELSCGRYVTFFDGDDVWGSMWIAQAYQAAEADRNPNYIYHPEFIYYFSADDFLVQSSSEMPNAGKSFHMVQADSRSTGFDPRTILFNNLWTANSFANQDVYRRFPYRHVNAAEGFGIEDWAWNAETMAGGCEHVVVADSVHCVRQKLTGSLSANNTRLKLLPPLGAFISQIEAL